MYTSSCMYVTMYMYIHIYIHSLIYYSNIASIKLYECMYTYVRMCPHACLYVFCIDNRQARADSFVCKGMHACMYVCSLYIYNSAYVCTYACDLTKFVWIRTHTYSIT